MALDSDPSFQFCVREKAVEVRVRRRPFIGLVQLLAGRTEQPLGALHTICAMLAVVETMSASIARGESRGGAFVWDEGIEPAARRQLHCQGCCRTARAAA
jgi:hypothetical protein